MSIVNTDYYLPREIQGDLDLPKIPGTNYPDPIAALYSNEGLDKDDT
jgi:hypothetical protein